MRVAGCLGASLAAVLAATPAVAAPADFGVGDVVFRKELREPLPNAFGGKDIWGRKRTTGSIEIRYRGLDAGTTVFTRRDTRLLTNETTINRSGMMFGSVGGKSVAIAGVGSGPTIQAMSPDETVIRIDPAVDPVLLVDGAALRVLEATASRVRVDVPEAAR